MLITLPASAHAIAMSQFTSGEYSNEYYIKNVNTGMFLNEGWAWGTQAVTKDYPCPFEATFEDEGVIFESPYGYFEPVDGEYYMDGSSPEAVYLEQIGDYYYIKCGGAYISINEERDYLTDEWLSTLDMCETILYTINQSDAPKEDNKSIWQIISRSEMESALNSATPTNPVEASFYLKAGDIQVGNRYNISAWPYVKSGEPSEIICPDGGWFGHGEWYNKTTFAWCLNDDTTVDCLDVVSQEVEGMPAGYYRVNFRAVNQGNAGVTPLVIKFNDTEASATNWEGSDLWYDSAQYTMAHNIQSAIFQVKEDGKLSIRMEKTSKVGMQNRFAFKSFALSYLGSADRNDEFEYEGIRYTVIDAEAKTCKTKAGWVDNGQYFAGNNLDGNLVIPSTVSDGTYEYSVVEIGVRGFTGTSISSVVIPESVTLIGEEAFRDCTSLTSIDLPMSLSAIKDGTFQNCSALASINMPETIASIGEHAFMECFALTSVTIPEAVASIGNRAFDYCNGLQDVIYLAETLISANEDIFPVRICMNATLSTPNATLEAVRTTVPWNRFLRIVASDGMAGFVGDGDDFEYEGLWYTVVDADEKTCKTKDTGNDVAGNLIIPATASYENEEYSVIGIGDESFYGSADLRSVSLPATIEFIGTNAFADCRRLTSFVWTRHESLSRNVTDEIGNPNLLLYVDSLRFAPEGMTANVVADGVCEYLDLTPGHAFTPLTPFTALRSRMVKEFTQKTYIDVCAGWETILLPFDAGEVYAENIGSPLTPFAALTDMQAQRPFWLYEADESGMWREASGIKPGIP
ncbi:MAG: leucine-rich repeat domain-containing protein [Muribaculaceae bacterium]|nr:leucine-rich repeat domain-containing protein [Muribaculaceae bacterium]